MIKIIPIGLLMLLILLSFCSVEVPENASNQVPTALDNSFSCAQNVTTDSPAIEIVDTVGPEYIYLLMAYQKHWSDDEFRENYDQPTYPIILWRLEDSSFSMVDTLNFNFANETNLKKLYHFPGQKWFFFHEYPLGNLRNYYKFPGKNPDFYSILDYSGDKIIVRREEFSSYKGNGRDTYFKWYLKKGDKFILWNENMGERKTWQFFAIDRFFNRLEIFPEGEFQHPINYGGAGFQDWEVPAYAFSRNNGELVISFNLGNENIEDNPTAWIQLPFELRLQKADLMLILIRPEWRYLVAKPRFYDQNKNDSLGNTVLIHDYEENSWEYIKLPGDYTIISSYGDWLYGMKRNFWNRDNEVERDSFNLLATRYGRKYSGKYGEIPQRWQGFTGMHYLYHIPSKKLIEWDAKDRDSEILTIKDGMIYYRVYDEIRKVPLDEVGKEIIWRKEEVIAKDKDIIPYVHHIFWAKKSPVINEWITPKPEGRR